MKFLENYQKICEKHKKFCIYENKFLFFRNKKKKRFPISEIMKETNYCCHVVKENEIFV